MEKEKQMDAVTVPRTDKQYPVIARHQGSAMLQDVWLMESLRHFDREVIPERRMHAKGSGAFGKFTVTEAMTQYTKASVFAAKNKETPVFVRFSRVAGERGAADAERDIRGFAIKFYTDEGNWDLVGNNTPVFFIRDAWNFSDLNYAMKRDSKTNMHSAQRTWNFWTILPEALQQVTIVMSDRGIPASYRHMDGFGSHTYSLINEKNERVWVKFHMKTQQGIKNLTNEEAANIVAKDRDSHHRDLFEAIRKKEYPRWTLYFQIMTEEQAENHKENPFDITKVWSHKEYPLIEAGVLELNRNPEDYFADVEKAAFNPGHLVPGIGLSPDKLLQGRLFAYGDAQRYRLGLNSCESMVNKERCPGPTCYRDNVIRVDENNGDTIGCVSNFSKWEERTAFQESVLKLEGDMDWVSLKEKKNDDCFYQTGDLYRLMNERQKQSLISNTVDAMSGVTKNIKYRHAVHCYLADEDYGRRLTNEMNLEEDRVIELAKLSDGALATATAMVK